MTWGRKDAEIQRAIDESSGREPGIWDVVYLAGKPCPGIAEVKLDLGADIDKRRKRGQKKSKPIDCGAKPAEVDVSLILRPSEWDAFSSEFAPLLFALAKNSAQNPISIGHPSLEPWGLDLFTIKGLSQPHPSGGFMKISFKGDEWSPDPKPISSVQKVTKDLTEAIAPVVADPIGAARTVIDRFF